MAPINHQPVRLDVTYDVIGNLHYSASYPYGPRVTANVTTRRLGLHTSVLFRPTYVKKPINHPPVRLDVIYDVTHYSTIALESCYPRVTVSIFS